MLFRSYGATANLTFQVQVPTSLGNEYQDTFSMVKWILVCDATPPEDIPDETTPLGPPTSEDEEIPDEPPPIDGPETGDSTFPAVMATIIAAVSAAVLVLFFLLLVKTRKEKEKADVRHNTRS